jgi:zinc and cadmium transporter
VLAHEVPQEVGDFALLLESGPSKVRALTSNLLSAAMIFPGVVAGSFLAEAVEPAVGVALALAAGGFLYVALADLVPDLHRRGRLETLQYQVAPLLLGLMLIWLLGRLEA